MLERSLSEDFDPHHYRGRPTAPDVVKTLLGWPTTAAGADHHRDPTPYQPVFVHVDAEATPVGEAPRVHAKKTVPRLRFITAVLGCLMLAMVFMHQVNINIALIRMVNHTSLELWVKEAFEGEKYAKYDYHFKNGTRKLRYVHPWDPIVTPIATMYHLDYRDDLRYSFPDGPMEFGPNICGVLHTAYFCGYLVFQIPGGLLAERRSARWTMFAGVALNVLGALLTPLMARLSCWALVVVRAMQGIGGAFSFPCMHALLACWAPKQERFFVYNLVYSGLPLGIVVLIPVLFVFLHVSANPDLGGLGGRSVLLYTYVLGYTLTALILEHLEWDYVFYIEGVISLPVLLWWALLVHDNPLTHPHITQVEKERIVTDAMDGKADVLHTRLPRLKKLVKSPPLWAIAVAQFTHTWGWYFFLLELPYFLATTVKYSAEMHACCLAIPYLAMSVVCLVTGKVWDTLLRKEKLNVEAVRKIGTVVSSVLPAICMVMTSMYAAEDLAVLCLLGVAVASQGTAFSGFFTNHMDLQRRCAGTLMGITTGFATLAAIGLPVYVRFTVANSALADKTFREVLGVTGTVYLVQTYVYNLFGSTVEQNWGGMGTRKADAEADNVEEIEEEINK